MCHTCHTCYSSLGVHQKSLQGKELTRAQQAYYLAYIAVDLNPADWATSVAQLAEHWTSNPVVTGSNPV